VLVGEGHDGNVYSMASRALIRGNCVHECGGRATFHRHGM
jgi:hypothetical protein